MRKFILGISLFLGGIIGFIGWIIGCAIIVNNRMAGFRLIEILEGSDLLFFGIFVVMALVGLCISFYECKKD